MKLERTNENDETTSQAEPTEGSVIFCSSPWSRDVSKLDIKTAFLYGELSEEIYLEQPEGYVAAYKKKITYEKDYNLGTCKALLWLWKRRLRNNTYTDYWRT